MTTIETSLLTADDLLRLYSEGVRDALCAARLCDSHSRFNPRPPRTSRARRGDPPGGACGSARPDRTGRA